MQYRQQVIHHDGQLDALLAPAQQFTLPPGQNATGQIQPKEHVACSDLNHLTI
ncbi:hypothetical protein SAM19_05359 [Brevibacillus laterosporus]|nr:hypothetical protein [Brevibacillus laterosporus]